MGTIGRDDEERGAAEAGAGDVGGHPRAAGALLMIGVVVFLVLVSLLGALGR